MMYVEGIVSESALKNYKALPKYYLSVNRYRYTYVSYSLRLNKTVIYSIRKTVISILFMILFLKIIIGVLRQLSG